MIHPEEYKIEQFVLGGSLSKAERAEIESHLELCSGCRADADEFRQIYADAQNELLSNSRIGERQSAGLVKRGPESVVPRSDDWLWIPPVRQSAVGRFQRFVGRNAVPLGFSTLGIVAILLIAIMRESKPSDSNPAYLSVDPGKRMFEVRNREGEILWRKFIEGDWSPGEKDQYANDLAVLADLDGDGKKEIVTILFSAVGPDSTKDCVQAYDAEGKLILNTKLGGPFIFRGERFSPVFTTRGLLVDTFGPNGETEIIVGIAHRHSPFAIIRLNSKGVVLGEYWHYGHFFGIRSGSLDGGRKKVLVLSGLNDEIGAGVISVVDPSTIVGERQSTVSNGYQWKKSNSELYYIRFPRTELDRFTKYKPRVTSPVWQSKEEYIFAYLNPAGTVFNYGIDYSFDSSFRLQKISPTDSERRLEAQLLAERKLSHPLSADYWKQLQNEVRYWNGTKWEANYVAMERVQMSAR